MAFFFLLSMIAMQAQPDRTDHALELIRQQKHEQAYQELAALVKDEPANTRAMAFLAAMELQTGRLADCQRHVDELVSKEPENPDLRELKGQLFMARREWTNAEVEWRWILNQRPNSEQAHMQLAAVLLQQDHFNDALAEVSKSLEINPKRSDARSLRGNIYASLSRMDDAALDWNIALVQDPDDTVALAGLAVYLRLTDPNRALELAKRAYDLTGGKMMGPIRVLTLVYRARNENDKARQVLEKALITYPNNDLLTAELNNLRNPNAKPLAQPPAAAKNAAPAPAKSAPIVVTTTISPAPAPGKSIPPTNTVATNPVPSKSTVVTPATSPANPATGKSTVANGASGKAAPPAPKPPAPPVVVAPAALESGLKVDSLAFGGLTLGASVTDLLAFERGPRPPQEPVNVALAPRTPATQRTITTAPPPKPTELPEPDLFWGKLPLSTISPAFVYSGAAAPAGYTDQPTSLGEAARRIREQQKKKP
jgi:tetratricopeptide (TPR) repeat protein